MKNFSVTNKQTNKPEEKKNLKLKFLFWKFDNGQKVLVIFVWVFIICCFENKIWQYSFSLFGWLFAVCVWKNQKKKTNYPKKFLVIYSGKKFFASIRQYLHNNCFFSFPISSICLDFTWIKFIDNKLTNYHWLMVSRNI